MGLAPWAPHNVASSLAAPSAAREDYMDTAQLLTRPHDMSVGDAAPYLEGFAAEMASVGYTPLTIGSHEHLIKRMLPALGADAGQYTVATVRTVILDQIRGCRPAYAKTFVGALRIYLRFLATSGACQPGLDHALPTVAEWKLSSLPRYLDAGQAARLCDSCRKDGPLGSRNRAIMLLLLRLGLRAGDIA